MPNKVKKWFMLQMWRLQQVAQPLTIAMLSVTVSLQVWGFVKWRNEIFANPVFGVPMILVPLVLLIWIIAIVWDIRLRMWREQMTVLAERNPYMLEKMSAKELLMFSLVYLPILERFSKDDPEARRSVEVIRAWMNKVAQEDPRALVDAEKILETMGGVKSKDPLGLEKK